ncbi:MAG: cyclopropane-fatty-acyl-phospholipid synthase family protein [Pyrinomonadaceae bacterium]
MLATLFIFFWVVTSSVAELRVISVNRPSKQFAISLADLQTNQSGQPDTGRTVGKRRRSVSRQLPLRKPDVIYYPTPDETVTEMLRLADIKQGDVLYDLGSGDGRIPIMAAQKYGIRAVGIEIDPKLVTLAEERAKQANVDGLVSFHNADMFRSNISEATVVTLYLSNKLNLLLRPKLLTELQPGSRILSHDFHMGDWEAEHKIRVPWQKGLFRTIYFWRVPTGSRIRTEVR